MSVYVTFDALAEFPYFAVAICADENDNWFTAGHTREDATDAFAIGVQRFTKPLYRVIAKFDAERIRRDLALCNMRAPSESRN